MFYFTTVDYRDRKKRAEILAEQFAHLITTIATTLHSLHECQKLYDAGVNSGQVMQEGSMEDEGLGKFLQRLQAGQDSSNNINSSEDDDKQEFHSPIKEP
jgi:hypothetical protein